MYPSFETLLWQRYQVARKSGMSFDYITKEVDRQGSYFAPDKIYLLNNSHPDMNVTHTYEYLRWEAGSYWTAIYMAYRNHKKNPMGAGIAAWDWFANEEWGK